jgi:hypothetical protein
MIGCWSSTLKVMGYVRYGFAARVDFVGGGCGPPAKKVPFTFWATPLIRFGKPQQGHSPKLIPLLSAGQSHRHTSGGRAETGGAYDFLKQSRLLPVHRRI